MTLTRRDFLQVASATAAIVGTGGAGARGQGKA